MIYSNKEISIARLNAKIYTQRNKLIDYENIIKEQKKQIKKLEKQLKIAVNILEVISTHTCFCDEDIKEQVSIVYNWSSEALEQIEELDK